MPEDKKPANTDLEFSAQVKLSQLVDDETLDVHITVEDRDEHHYVDGEPAPIPLSAVDADSLELEETDWEGQRWYWTYIMLIGATKMKPPNATPEQVAEAEKSNLEIEVTIGTFANKKTPPTIVDGALGFLVDTIRKFQTASGSVQGEK
jgi:hypothetical protein